MENCRDFTFSSIYMIRVAMPYINRQLHRGLNKVDNSANEIFGVVSSPFDVER